MEPQRGDHQRPFLASRLAEDRDLLAEVETAERLGISLKRLRGWEPRTLYEHERGVLVSSRPETEWDETEQAWMLALHLYRETRCTGCGGDLSVTTLPENEELFKAELPLQCFRCVAFGRSHDAYADQPYTGSLIHLVPPRPTRRGPSSRSPS